MKRSRRLSILFVILLSSCAGHLSPQATPEEKLNLLRLNVATAVDDAVDGIIAANDTGYLNDNDTVLVLKSLHVVLETVRTAPEPKSIILNAVKDIQKQLTNTSLEKWNPYLNSLIAVVSAL